MHCESCSNSITVKQELFVVCGKCCNAFHAGCVGLKENALRVLSKNIIWLCDDCLQMFCNDCFRDLMDAPQQTVEVQTEDREAKIMKDVDELKAQVAEIVKILSLADGLQKSTPPKQSSTPISSPECDGATNSANNSTSNVNRLCRDHGRDHSFSLLLSNVDRRVTEQDIDRLVFERLGISNDECFKVTKLVPKWKAYEELDYISFKVDLDERWRKAAISTDTWPREVKCREFINQQRIVWSP